MIKKSLPIVIMCIGLNAFTQETPKDSLAFMPNNSLSIIKKQVSIRAGGGLQNSFYAELGLALHECNYGCTGFFSNAFYGSLEWIPSRNRDIYGVKIGYEINAYLLNLGLETKYQTDFKEKDVVLTPKIGLGLYGDLNIFYGYNISINNSPFRETIGQHQLSIIFNINDHFLQ